MLELGVKTLLAYLLGSLIGSLLVGQLRGGVDIRKLGSGNAGGTNALRTQGWSFALWVMIIDIGKGWLAAGLLAPMNLPGIGIDPQVERDWLAVACAAAVVLGHVYPVWYGFRGGKGAATLIGVLVGLKPAAILPVFAVWLVTVMLTGFVGLGTMLAVAVFSRLSGVDSKRSLRWPCWFSAAAMTLFVCYTHRANIERMRDRHREPGPPALAAAAPLNRKVPMPTSSKATPKTQAQARRQRLLAMLAEGTFYSGEQLAKKLKISRGGIWKLMNSLKALGVDIESVPRQGYRLPRAVDLLDKETIVASLPAASRSLMERADVLLTVDSTNRFVADLPPPAAGTLSVVYSGSAERGPRSARA